MNFKKTMEAMEYKVSRSPGMGYIIRSRQGKTMRISDELFLSIGYPRRKYTHKKSCSYHIDNYDDSSWRLPRPPNCDCPYEKLEPYTERDIINTVLQLMRR